MTSYNNSIIKRNCLCLCAPVQSESVESADHYIYATKYLCYYYKYVPHNTKYTTAFFIFTFSLSLLSLYKM